jgi:hypothetical protein
MKQLILKPLGQDGKHGLEFLARLDARIGQVGKLFWIDLGHLESVNGIEHVLEGGSEVEHVSLGSIPKTIDGFAR